MISKSVPDAKYLNSLYLQENVVIELINKSSSLVDIGFILERHLSRKVKHPSIDYCESIMNSLKARVEELLTSPKFNPQSLLRVQYAVSFQASKMNSPDSKYQIAPFDHETN